MAKILTRDEARRIAANVAKLRDPIGQITGMFSPKRAMLPVKRTVECDADTVSRRPPSSPELIYVAERRGDLAKPT